MNQVVVGNRNSGTREECTVGWMNWIAIAEPEAPMQAEVQIRYRSRPAKVTVVPLEAGRVKLIFNDPQFGVTPGQAAVLYEGEIVLGGGIIERF